MKCWLLSGFAFSPIRKEDISSGQNTILCLCSAFLSDLLSFIVHGKKKPIQGDIEIESNFVVTSELERKHKIN